MNKVNLLSRIYAWSVALELLLFFVIQVGGIRSNISRFLQIIVLIGLMLKWLLNVRLDRVRIVNFASHFYRYYMLYFSLAVFAGIIGIFHGAYQVFSVLDQSTSNFKGLVSSSNIRSILEYFISLYYFLYFVVLPHYMFKSKEGVNYFLSLLKVTFIISFVAGIIDFGFSSVNHPLLSKSLANYITVGVRFHGFAGEPRDAFVYLFFGLAIMHLQAYFKGVNLNKWWIPIIFIAALMTQSASGLVGIVFFIALYCIYSLRKISLARIVQLITIIFLITVFLYIAIIKSERIMSYAIGLSGLWQALETKGRIPYPIGEQVVNIYPIYDLIVKFRNLNFLPIIIGSGLGSSSVLNNQFFNIYELRNTHSQFVRLIYETGVIGVFLFINAFVYPVRYLIRHLSSKKQEEFILIVLLLLGCFFSHRHVAIFVYSGVFIAVFRVLHKVNTNFIKM